MPKINFRKKYSDAEWAVIERAASQENTSVNLFIRKRLQTKIACFSEETKNAYPVAAMKKSEQTERQIDLYLTDPTTKKFNALCEHMNMSPTSAIHVLVVKDLIANSTL